MNALPKLVIIGAGGFGREAFAWAEQSVQYGKKWLIKGFIDDNLEALKSKLSPGKLLGTIGDYQPTADEVFICAIGVPSIKKKCTELIASRGGEFTQLIHRTVVLGYEVALDEGVILCPYVVISANNRLGKGVGVNLHASIDHDANVGDWSQVNCHCDLTAEVEVGKEVFMGSRVSVIPKVRIGDGAYIGAGSVVLRDVAPGFKMVGSPARRIG
jgi:sugar O-acyltransferase (sialic acid O-acetyltransferase NeuD family)